MERFMLSLKIELSGKNRTAFFGIDIRRSNAQVDSVVSEDQDELVVCTEHVDLPNIVTLKAIQDEWVKAGIIV